MTSRVETSSPRAPLLRRPLFCFHPVCTLGLYMWFCLEEVSKVIKILYILPDRGWQQSLKRNFQAIHWAGQ